MTYAQSVKDEILKNMKGLRACCQQSFLLAVLGGSSSFNLQNGQLCPTLTTRDEKLAQVSCDIAQKHLSSTPQLVKEQKGKHQKFDVTFDGDVAQKLGLVQTVDGAVEICDTIPPMSNCCKTAFIKGLFCTFGSVTIPKPAQGSIADKTPSQSYHLEIALPKVAWCDQVLEILTSVVDGFKVTEREESVLFYLKDAEHIGNMLVAMGAVAGKLMLENVLVERSIRNNANRQANCISANIYKTVADSEKQILAIQKLKNNGKLQKLSDELTEVAEARLNNPEATLLELATRLNLTKNCVNKRLYKLIELSQKC